MNYLDRDRILHELTGVNLCDGNIHLDTFINEIFNNPHIQTIDDYITFSIEGKIFIEIKNNILYAYYHKYADIITALNITKEWFLNIIESEIIKRYNLDVISSEFKFYVYDTYIREGIINKKLI